MINQKVYYISPRSNLHVYAFANLTDYPQIFLIRPSKFGFVGIFLGPALVSPQLWWRDVRFRLTLSETLKRPGWSPMIWTTVGLSPIIALVISFRPKMKQYDVRTIRKCQSRKLGTYEIGLAGASDDLFAGLVLCRRFDEVIGIDTQEVICKRGDSSHDGGTIYVRFGSL